jgi:hypothetical protein
MVVVVMKAVLIVAVVKRCNFIHFMQCVVFGAYGGGVTIGFRGSSHAHHNHHHHNQSQHYHH